MKKSDSEKRNGIDEMYGRQERVVVREGDPRCHHLHLICTGKLNRNEYHHMIWQCEKCWYRCSLPMSQIDRDYTKKRKVGRPAKNKGGMTWKSHTSQGRIVQTR